MAGASERLAVQSNLLPGIGTRYEFVTRAGRRVGTVALQGGGTEVFITDEHDSDRVAARVLLDDAESLTLADLLGGTRFTRELSELQQAVEGIAVDWLPLRGDSFGRSRSIADLMMRTQTGTSIVAVVRNGQPVPAPGPSFVLHPGDVLVVVGTPEGIAAAGELLTSGD